MDQENERIIDPSEIAAGFEPFKIPADYQFEPEFSADTPRQIPPHLRKGPYEAKFNQGINTAFWIGAFCFAFSFLNFVKNLGYYILPLGYLNWIGIAIMAISGLAWIIRKFKAGRYKYVRNGIPIAVRVLETYRFVENEEAVKELKFLSLVELIHPETSQLGYCWIKSPKVAGTTKPEKYECTIESGEYVTAVYMPEQFEKTLQIYGYLELDPDVEFIRQTEETLSAKAKTIATVCCVIGIFLVFIGGVCSIGYFSPTEFNPWSLFGAMGVVGLFGIIIAAMLKAKSKSKVGSNEPGYILCGIAGLVLGMLSAAIVLPFLNAVVDSTEPEYREIEVVEFWQETWDYIFRNYQIEYRILDQSKTEKRTCMLDHMHKFEQSLAGVLEIRTGLFGWKWISNIWPAALVHVDQDGNGHYFTHEQSIAYNDPNSIGVAFKIDLMIDKGEDEFMPISGELRQHILTRQQSQAE